MKQSKKKTSKHIAMIGHKHVPSREGGVEIVVWELSTRLKERGFIVDCYNRGGYHLTSRDYDHYKDKKGNYRNGIRIIIVPTVKNGKFNAIVYSFFATIRALFGHYDCIHYHAEGPCLMIWLPKILGIHTVATIHGLDWQRAKWGGFATKMLRLGEKFAAKYADEVIVLSDNVREYFEKTYSRKTLFIPNGVNRPTYKKANLILEKYGLNGNDYFMTLCRIVPEKGIHYVIEAFKELPTDKKLVICGGDSNAREYMEQIKKMASLDDRIIMTGFIQGEILEELLSNAYVYLLPSDVEGMSISLLEAMSYGNCCLVSDIKENVEVVEDKAVSFKHGNVPDLALKMQELIQDPERVNAYKSKAADFICTKYSWEDVTDRTAELY